MNNLTGETFIQTLSCSSFTCPLGAIGDENIESDAGIEATKLVHRFQPVLADTHTTTTVAERKIVHLVQGTSATLNQAFAGVTTATSAGTVSVDIWKNGSTILTSTMSITSSLAAFSLLNAAIANQDLVQNDVLEVVVTVSGSPTSAGLFVELQIDETAQ